MLKVLSYILCDLDPKVKVIGQKAGICDGVPSTSALVPFIVMNVYQFLYTLATVLKNNIWNHCFFKNNRQQFVRIIEI